MAAGEPPAAACGAHCGLPSSEDEGEDIAVKDLLTIAASRASLPLVVSDREVHNTASIRPSIELRSVAIELLMQRVVIARFEYHVGVC
jgi:hypothetical protein